MYHLAIVHSITDRQLYRANSQSYMQYVWLVIIIVSLNSDRLLHKWNFKHS